MYFLFLDDAAWNTCPVGLLPWQRDQQVLNCDLPKVRWKPRKPLLERITAPSQQSQRKVEWVNAKRKRPRKPTRVKTENQDSPFAKIFKAMLDDRR